MQPLHNHFQTQQTPQSEPVPGANQVKNSAGGFGFGVDDWTRLDRFLILGTSGGTYYASESKLTKENAEAAVRCVQSDGLRTVKRIVEISDSGRAAKNDYALYALALATKFGDEETRRLAYASMDKVARIGTHLFNLAEYRQAFGGWGRGTRKGFANWYLSKDIDKIAYQAIKYRQRDGWTHKDILRLSHPQSNDNKINNLFKWIVGKEVVKTDLPKVVVGFEALQATKDAKVAANLIREYNLPREAVPTELLTEKLVWEALLEKMPMTAMIRNLANMSRIGLLVPFSDAAKKVVTEIKNQEKLYESRIHPIAVLAALLSYKEGVSRRDSGKSWQVVPQIVDALDEAFHLSFKNVTPTGKNMLLALDCSGSMDCGNVTGIEALNPRTAAAAMAMVTARTEPNYQFIGFSTTIIPLNITAKDSLDDVVEKMKRVNFGGTDCSQPMLYAIKHKLDVDAFVTYTDNETWAGNIHPFQALQEFNKRMGKQAKLVTVGMTSTGFSIADPKDPRMLDVVGFDTNAPAMISEFISG